MAASHQGEEGEDGGNTHVAGAPPPPDPEGFVAGVLELGARAVPAQRVALWIMEGGGGAAEGRGRLLRRIHLYHAATGAHTAGGILREDRHGRYFNALDADDLLVVDDVSGDARTAELAAPYARPLGIRSWIDQQVRLPDGRRAILRFERGGEPRRWTSEEVGTARTVTAALRGAPAGNELTRRNASDDGGSEEARRDEGGGAGEDRADGDYRRLLEHGRVGTLRLGPEGTILHPNAGFLSLVEASDPESVTGRSIREFLDDQDHGDRLVSRLRDLDELPLEELRLRTGRDRVAWALMTAVRASGGDGHLALLLDVTAQKERERELERQAHFDPLTGLPNRRFLWQQATRLLALAERQERSAAVAYLDLSGFKEINDRYGHVAGDRVLEAVGRRLDDALRESDVGARIGGDEFAVLLSAVDGFAGAREAGRRILESVNRPVEVRGETIQVRARAGVALYPDHGRSLDELLDRADQAMYVAYTVEEAIPVEIYRPSEAPPSPRPDRATRDLQRAVEDDEFILHYQPVVGLPRGDFSGVEALIRWRHPRHGLLEPSAFLSEALQAGLLVEIDRWVLRRAVRQAAHWQRRDGPGWVSVNLSLPSLRDPALAPFLAGELRQAGLEPRRLILEVSEPDLRKAGAAGVATLSAARELGVRLAADCREMGPAVRSSLTDLEVDLVKVELDLIRDELDAGRGRPAEGTLAEILADPDVPVLAEGIETEGEFAWARGSSFTMAQGYYMSRPAPASEIRFRGAETADEDGGAEEAGEADEPDEAGGTRGEEPRPRRPEPPLDDREEPSSVATRAPTPEGS